LQEAQEKAKKDREASKVKKEADEKAKEAHGTTAQHKPH
jgi:hypothetical protein